jgi:hypothetical protein
MSKLWYYGYSMFYEVRAARRRRPVAVPVDLLRLSAAPEVFPRQRLVVDRLR